MDEDIVGKYKGKIVRLGLSNGEEVAGTLVLVKASARKDGWVPAHVQLTNASGEAKVEYMDIVSLKTKQEVAQ